ncbi:hypothetical protein MMC25_007429 [Agyrium rufum]|nr:hypothetical protein [Agyrium rufum]
MRLLTSVCLIFAVCLAFVAAWTKEDHEIFRLRDELQSSEGLDVNFYDFVGVKSSATKEDITKSVRKKAKTMHPDKVKQSFVANSAKPPKSKSSKSKPGVHVSKGPSEREVQRKYKEANERFARLGVVAELLRGPSRERYDYFLQNGFPLWRGTGYYYDRFRPGLGSVLIGLFVFGGGLAHYGALLMSWRRQKDFVERYITQAKRTAWGDDVGIPGIPGLEGNIGAPVVPPSSTTTGTEDVPQMNRRQKRMQEKENKREGKKPKSARASGTSTPLETTTAPITPQGQKKRVQAENGKVLLVDSVGNVFLQDQNEDGETIEFLLDPDEIPRPTFKQTALVRVPVWLWQTARKRIMGLKDEEVEDDDSSDDLDGDVKHEANGTKVEDSDEPAARLKAAINGSAKGRARKNGKAR